MHTNNAVDVEALQNAVERVVTDVGAEPPFLQLRLRQLRPVLAQSVHVERNPPLIGRTAYEKVWVVINRVVRRVAGLTVGPVVDRQNDGNARMRRSIEHLIASDATLHAAIVRLRARSADDGP